MRTSKIEPGLLPVFRLFVGARVALLTLTFCSRTSGEPRRLQRPGLGLLETGLLLIYLSWPWLRQRLGRAYLPVALTIASVGPIMEHAANVMVRLRHGATATEANADAWTVIAALFVPLVLIAWQYGFRSVIGFSIGTFIFDLVLGIPVAVRGGPALVTVVGLGFVRSFLYLMVGYLVARLMAAQRLQRDALARANTQLKQYAATIERLSVSRERNRMARELHDTLAHTLSAVSVQLEAMEALWGVDQTAARHTLDKAQTLTRDGLGEVRRSLQALRAKPLEDLGLGLAIQRLAETTAERAGLALQAQIDTTLSAKPEIEQGVYRIAEESMTNVLRHANAKTLTVTLRQHRRALTLTVQDDGIGFDPAAQGDNGRYGLVGMHERATLCGGSLAITSQPQHGTIVQFTVEESA